MLKAQWCKYRLGFRFLAKTSREEMRTKDTYFVKIFDTEDPDTFGIGECALFRGLSAEDMPDYENILSESCRSFTEFLPEMSSIRIGFETALADLKNGGQRNVFPSRWQAGEKGIKINGLIWMGDKATMTERVKEKIGRGFKILKLKIGGIDFEEELSILKAIRNKFGEDELELRLDANGSFTPDNAMYRLESLSRYGIHSIEQPIAAGQPDLMRKLCQDSPIDIALDEELIGFRSDTEMANILEEIRPRYIILKPSLCGGFERADAWIETAMRSGIDWWATSALESNIGLNAIAQWVAGKDNPLAQGLGTGELYDNNIESPIEMKSDELVYSPKNNWIIPNLPWQA